MMMVTMCQRLLHRLVKFDAFLTVFQLALMKAYVSYSINDGNGER
jgi:hypothetical protein